jgi:hypothetical protein
MYKIISGIGVLAVCGAATGQTFDDRMAFEAAAAGANIPLSFESFEGLPLDPSSAQRDTVAVDDFQIDAVNEGFTFITPLSVLGATGPGGTFATDGDQHINVGSLFNSGQNNDVVVTFTFNSPIAAFFLDLTDLLGLDQALSPRAILTTDAGDSLTIFDDANPGSDLQSVGLINAATFTEVTIRATAGDSFGIDAVSYGVPAPGAAAVLAGAGLLGLRRRR